MEEEILGRNRYGACKCALAQHDSRGMFYSTHWPNQKSFSQYVDFYVSLCFGAQDKCSEKASRHFQDFKSQT